MDSKLFIMLMLFFFICCCSCRRGSEINSNQSDWIVTWGGRGGDIVWDIDVDSEFISVIGSYTDDCRFPGKSGNMYLNTIDTNTDFLFAEFLYDGSSRNEYFFGGPGRDDGTAIATCSNGIFIAGIVSETIDLRPGILTSHCENVIEDGYSAFITAFDANNSFLYSRCFSTGTGILSSEPPSIKSMTVCGDYLYATGYFDGVIDFDQSAKVDERTSNGRGDILILKYNIDGTYIWCKTFGGESDFDWGEKITSDQEGNLYVCGSIGHDPEGVDMDPGQGISLNSTYQRPASFLVKIDQDANLEWARIWGSSVSGASGYAESVAVQGSIVYVVGGISGPIDLSPLGSSMDMTSVPELSGGYVISINSDGEYISSYSLYGDDAVMDVCCNGEEVFITGLFGQEIKFQDNEIPSHGGWDIYVLALSTELIPEHLITFGGSGQERVNCIACYGDYVYVAGSFEDFVDFPVNGTQQEFAPDMSDCFLLSLKME